MQQIICKPVIFFAKKMSEQDFFLPVIASRRQSNPEMADCPTD
jgi:hypothetical protein